MTMHRAVMANSPAWIPGSATCHSPQPARLEQERDLSWEESAVHIHC